MYQFSYAEVMQDSVADAKEREWQVLDRSIDLLSLAREMREHGRNAIWVASDLLRGEKS